jgi:hypothetical protein
MNVLVAVRRMGEAKPVPGEFRICRRHLRIQDELSQSFDFLIFKRGNQIQMGLGKDDGIARAVT